MPLLSDEGFTLGCEFADGGLDEPARLGLVPRLLEDPDVLRGFHQALAIHHLLENLVSEELGRDG